MAVNYVNIINGFAQQDTLCTQVVNIPETLYVHVNAMPDVHMDSITRDAMDSLLVQADSITSIITNISKDGAGYPSAVSVIAIPLIIAIFAFAAPLVLQVLQGIDNKYGSTRILNTYKSSLLYKIFWGGMLLTFIDLCAWIIVRLYIGEYSSFDKLLLLNSLLLLVLTVLLSLQSVAYFDLRKLCDLLIDVYENCHYICLKKNLEDRKQRIFVSCSELLKYSIIKNDKEHIQLLLSWIQEQFRACREVAGYDKETTYPEVYYQAILEINETLCQKSQTHSFVDASGRHFMPFDWLFPTYDEKNGIFLCEKSYQTIWECLLQYVIYKQYDLFKAYWGTAVEYANVVSGNNSDKFIRFNEKVLAILVSEEQYEIFHNLVCWHAEKKRRSDIFKLTIHDILPHEKLVSLNKENILCRYLLLLEDLKANAKKYPLPNKTATKSMPIPIEEYCKRMVALLYAQSLSIDDEYFYIPIESEPCLPHEIDIPGISRKMTQLKACAMELARQETVKNAMNISEEALNSIDILLFVKEIEKIKKTECNFASICDESKNTLDKCIIEDFDRSIKSLEKIVENKVTKGNSEEIDIDALGFIHKELLVKPLGTCIEDECIKRLRNNIFCALHSRMIQLLEDTYVVSKEVSGHDGLLKVLDERINRIKNKEDYLIVVADTKKYYFFESQVEYNGIQIICFPITFSKETACRVWLMKKADWISYRIIKNQEKEFEGYRYTTIDEQYHIKRLLIDIGQSQQDIKELLGRYIPQKYDLDTTVFVACAIKIAININKSAKVFCVKVNNIPPYAEQSYYDYMNEEPDYDEYTPPIVSKEEHNKKSLAEDMIFISK